MQYILTSKCVCLISGTACIWLHFTLKIIYYRSNALKKNPLAVAVLTLNFSLMLAAIVVFNRIDMLVALLVGLVEIAFMEGGTIKYPKEVFQ